MRSRTGTARLAVLTGIVLGLQAALPAQAALPPEYQRVREFQAILDSHAVIEALAYEPIETLEFVQPDLYAVTAGFCSLEVRIVSDPPPAEEGWVGPRQFHVEIGAVVCE